MGTDVTGADLTNAKLPHIDEHVDVKWSVATRWGRAIDEIQTRSVELSEGAYLLNRTTGRRRGALVDR